MGQRVPRQRAPDNWVQGSLAEAETWHAEALRVAREIQSAWDEAHALAGEQAV